MLIDEKTSPEKEKYIFAVYRNISYMTLVRNPFITLVGRGSIRICYSPQEEHTISKETAMRKQVTKVFHALICEEDESYLKALCNSVRHYSEEYRIMITIHSCLTMPLNPDDVVDLGILVDFVIINTNFGDGRGIDIAKSIQRGKSPTPIILFTEKQLDWEDMNFIFPIGILEYPIVERNFELLFQRILGQIFFGKYSKYKERQHLAFVWDYHR